MSAARTAREQREQTANPQMALGDQRQVRDPFFL